MKCPSCGSDLISLDERPPRGCPCGWRRGRLVRVRRDFEGSGPVNPTIVVVLWMVTVAIIGGSYWLLNFYQQPDIYWRIGFCFAWLMYILFCWFVRQPSTSDVTFREFVWDNPFTLDDDANRIRFFLMLFMIPGKFICYTLSSTWAVFQKLAAQ